MAVTFQTFARVDITEKMLRDAAKLFSENYGTWGRGTPMQGKRVTLSARRLREQYLPEVGQCRYISATSDGELIGQAFTSRWQYDGKNVCWVTQLVVHQGHRGKGIATMLMRQAKAESDDVYGIMSSHPYACVAAAAAFGTGIENVSIDFIRQHSDPIMQQSLIPYIKAAKVSGSLFGENMLSGLISGVNTEFFVDHREPLQALDQFQNYRIWPLGSLPDGHEYLLVVPAKPR